MDTPNKGGSVDKIFYRELFLYSFTLYMKLQTLQFYSQSPTPTDCMAALN